VVASKRNISNTFYTGGQAENTLQLKAAAAAAADLRLQHFF